MSYQLHNPISMTGERGGPPEYTSDNPCTCSRCSAQVDLDDDTLYDAVTRVRDGRRVPSQHVFERVCKDCMERCEGCSLPLDSENATQYGPLVSIPLWESDGRCKLYHAWCGMSYLLGSWMWPDAPGHFDAEMASREQIAKMVAAAFGKKVTA